MSRIPYALPGVNQFTVQTQAADDGATLIVIVDGDRQQIPIATLADETGTAVLRDRLLGAGTLCFVLTAILSWPVDVVRSVVRFVADFRGSHQSITFSAGEEEEPGDDLLAVVVSLIELGRGPIACRRAIDAAVEVAAALYPGELAEACSAITRRLRQQGITGHPPRELLAVATRRARAAAVSAADNSDECAVELLDAVLPDAPLEYEAIVPTGWSVNADGIFKHVDDALIQVSHAPVLISRRLVEVIEGGAESIEIAWRRDGVWQRRVVDRGIIATTRQITSLASNGVPVTSENAKDVVQFLADFEAANIEIMPLARMTRHLGWQGEDGAEGFMWGRTLINGEDSPTGVPDDAEGPQPDRTITFVGRSDGEEQLVDGFRAGGSIEGWVDSIRELAIFPTALLALYGALAPAMLLVLRTFNFVLSFAGATSTGKTTVLRVAASCWGYPFEDLPGSTLATWDSSRVWIERASAVQGDLPVTIDDTKRARRPTDISQTVYDATSGKGRGRGTPDGIRAVGSWRIVLIASGEVPLASFTEDGGARARVIEGWGSPFGDVTEATARLTTQLNDTLRENFGHAGPRFIQFLIDNRARWQEWREQYESARQRFQARAGRNSVAARMAAHFAALEVTAILAHEALNLPWTYTDTIAELWPALTAETGEADRAGAALDLVTSWAFSHQKDFMLSSYSDQPGSGWPGRWQVDRPDGNLLAFYPHRLDELLEQAGFDPEATKRLWKGRGWLCTDEGRTTKKIRIRPGAGPESFIAIRWEAIRARQEEGAEPAAPRRDLLVPG